jgi:CheY-like chemotaxis protein/cytidylate kinase
MSTLSVFSGCFCKDDLVVKEILSLIKSKLLIDGDVVAAASRLSGISENKISRAFSAKTSVFNQFTHEKECSIAYLKLAMAELLGDDNLLITGFASQLIPREIQHVLRVCLIADLKYRISVAVAEQGLSEKEATKQIHKHDEDRSVWIENLLKVKDPWDASLYDIVIPMDKHGVEQAAALIVENSGKDVVRITPQSLQAVDDFRLAAQVEVALTGEGHNVAVKAESGAITLTINKHVLMLSRLEEELKSIARGIAGVQSVQTEVGKEYHQADIYRKHDFKLPAKVLLVDDEREFVQTLSERLMMREMGSAIAYDGESALNLINEDEPEVMILDLKMPGIDGIEVLRRVKATRPEIEVIILTGHGTDSDRDLCLKLGAYAYLQKPVDIDLLSATLKKAYAKTRQKQSSPNK